MRVLAGLTALLVVTLIVSGQANREANTLDILKLAAETAPTVTWDRKSLLRADIKGDGKLDCVMLGLDEGNVYVFVAYPPLESGAKTEILKFKVDASSEGSLCGLPAKLTTESLDYDPAEAIGKPLPGFERSKTARALNLSDGRCDPFHLFWNHRDGRLEWWRL